MNNYWCPSGNRGINGGARHASSNWCATRPFRIAMFACRSNICRCGRRRPPREVKPRAKSKEAIKDGKFKRGMMGVRIRHYTIMEDFIRRIRIQRRHLKSPMHQNSPTPFNTRASICWKAGASFANVSSFMSLSIAERSQVSLTHMRHRGLQRVVVSTNRFVGHGRWGG